MPEYVTDNPKTSLCSKLWWSVQTFYL
jgi:hypothetical protein